MKTAWKNFDITTLPTRLIHHFDLCDIWTVNTYLMCNFGCLYCSSQMQGDAKPLVSNEEAIDVLHKELLGKPTLNWYNLGTMTDPYPPLEEKLQLSRLILSELMNMRRKIVLCTKSTLVLRDIDLLREYCNGPDDPNDKLIVRVSVSFMDEKWQKYFEPFAPTTEERFQVIEQLVEAGIPVAVNAWPWVPYATDTAALIARTPKGVPINFNPLIINRDSQKITYQDYSFTQDEIYELYVAEHKRIGEIKGVSWNYPWSFDEKYNAVGKTPKDNMPIMHIATAS